MLFFSEQSALEYELSSSSTSNRFFIPSKSDKDGEFVLEEDAVLPS